MYTQRKKRAQNSGLYAAFVFSRDALPSIFTRGCHNVNCRATKPFFLSSSPLPNSRSPLLRTTETPLLLPTYVQSWKRYCLLPEREKEKYKRNITRAHLSHFSSSLVKSGRPTAMQVGESHSNYVLNSRFEERERWEHWVLGKLK